MRRRPPQAWYPRRGEVYLVGRDNPRPALIISVDALNRHAADVCLVPITSVAHPRFLSTRIPIQAGEGGLRADSWVKCDQVTTLAKTYLQFPPLGTLSPAALRAVQEKIALALGLI